MKIVMVCLGNICRSPLAEGILRDKIQKKGLDWTVDSAGTGGWHAGELPDERSIQIARQRGIDLTDQRARQFGRADFERFDHILVMDTSNYTNVLRLAQTGEHRSKVAMILNYAYPGQDFSVPDPYYGGPDGFVEVFDLLEEACEAFLQAQLST
jgi:protein-tyrosine phosphatase